MFLDIHQDKHLNKIKKTIRTNFDAGVPKNLQQNTYSVLIATDAISEGYN